MLGGLWAVWQQEKEMKCSCFCIILMKRNNMRKQPKEKLK